MHLSMGGVSDRLISTHSLHRKSIQYWTWWLEIHGGKTCHIIAHDILCQLALWYYNPTTELRHMLQSGLIREIWWWICRCLRIRGWRVEGFGRSCWTYLFLNSGWGIGLFLSILESVRFNFLSWRCILISSYIFVLFYT